MFGKSDAEPTWTLMDRVHAILSGAPHRSQQEQRLISTGDVKKGVIIELDGQLMKVLDWTHIKMARGSAQVRMKLQNVRKGDIIERTFQAGTRWPRARVEQRKAQYLYGDGEAFHFMDTETYDQFAIGSAMIGDDARFLLENTDVFVSTHDGEVLGVDLPVTVDLKVVQTDPGFAGDTATGAKKPATLETGLVIQVPLFVSEGDVLRVDTRTAEYVTRVQ
jgi:elongation factor P